MPTVQVTRRGPAPDRKAVEDIWKGMTLDEELSGFGGEVMSNFI